MHLVLRTFVVRFCVSFLRRLILVILQVLLNYDLLPFWIQASAVKNGRRTMRAWFMFTMFKLILFASGCALAAVILSICCLNAGSSTTWISRLCEFETKATLAFHAHIATVGKRNQTTVQNGWQASFWHKCSRRVSAGHRRESRGRECTRSSPC